MASGAPRSEDDRCDGRKKAEAEELHLGERCVDAIVERGDGGRDDVAGGRSANGARYGLGSGRLDDFMYAADL